MARIARIGSGIGLVLTGTVLLVLPGPGILTIAAGLAVLSKDFRWAASTLDWMKVRFRSYFTRQAPANLPSEGPSVSDLVDTEPDYDGG